MTQALILAPDTPLTTENTFEAEHIRHRLALGLQ